MMVKTKQPTKTKHNKIKKILFNLGNPKELNRDQLSQLAQGFNVKYALGLEETVLEQHKDKLSLQKTVSFQQKIIEENKKGIATLVDKYEDHVEDLEKQLQECNAKRAEAVRAYNGLHSLGKFAEEQGIDLKNAKEDLPESEKNKYNFSQKHTVLESGKVKHEFFLKPKKNGKGPK